MRDVSSIQVEWLLELAPHFYVDRRKHMLEAQHKREALKNIEHDYISTATGKRKEPERSTSITASLNKQTLKFRKGMNFSNIESPSLQTSIEDKPL
jgi:hypothetical protein